MFECWVFWKGMIDIGGSKQWTNMLVCCVAEPRGGTSWRYLVAVPRGPDILFTIGARMRTNSSWDARFFYKNKLYKNIEAEKPRKFKNILRISWGSDLGGQKMFFLCFWELRNALLNPCIIHFVCVIRCLYIAYSTYIFAYLNI